MLKVSAVTKQYAGPHGRLDVLTDVDFALAPGESAAIS